MQVFEKDVLAKVTNQWQTALELKANEQQLMIGARKGWILMEAERIRLSSGAHHFVRKFKHKEVQS